MPAPPTLQRTQMILDVSFIPSVSVSARNVKFTSTVSLPQNIRCLKRTSRIYPYFTSGFYFTCVLEELELEIGVWLSFVVLEFLASLGKMRWLCVFTNVFKNSTNRIIVVYFFFFCGASTRFRVMAPPHGVSPENSDTPQSAGLLCGRVISPLQRPLSDNTQQSEDYLNVLTPWSRVHLEKLTGFEIVKTCCAFYGTRRFITAFTSAV
jgi:hypothetical protein